MGVTSDRVKAGRDAAMTPLMLLVAFVVLMCLWQGLGLPNPNVLYSWIVELYQRYGLVIVAIAAFVEGIVLINFWFPGSAVIILGMVASRGNPMQATLIVAVVSLAFSLAAQVNYLIGFAGLHGIVARWGGKEWLNRSRRNYERYGVYTIPPTFVHPNLGAFMSVTCGISRLKWRQFVLISVAATCVWNCVWGVVSYFLADGLANVATNPAMIVGFKIGRASCRERV